MDKILIVKKQENPFLFLSYGSNFSDGIDTPLVGGKTTSATNGIEIKKVETPIGVVPCFYYKGRVDYFNWPKISVPEKSTHDCFFYSDSSSSYVPNMQILGNALHFEDHFRWTGAGTFLTYCSLTVCELLNDNIVKVVEGSATRFKVLNFKKYEWCHLAAMRERKEDTECVTVFFNGLPIIYFEYTNEKDLRFGFHTNGMSYGPAYVTQLTAREGFAFDINGFNPPSTPYYPSILEDSNPAAVAITSDTESTVFNILKFGNRILVPPKEKDFVVIGGRKYPVVKIGDQLWTAENLDWKIDGITINPYYTSYDSPSYPCAWYYNDDEATYGIEEKKYGLLYNGHSRNYIISKQSELFPKGWHIPSLSEFDMLAQNVGGLSIAGTKLKSKTEWTRGAGTDDYGFNALPAGYRRNGSNPYSGVGKETWFWATENLNNNPGHPMAKCFSYSSNSMSQDYWHAQYCYGSIRLVKDV